MVCCPKVGGHRTAVVSITTAKGFSAPELKLSGGAEVDFEAKLEYLTNVVGTHIANIKDLEELSKLSLEYVNQLYQKPNQPKYAWLLINKGERMVEAGSFGGLDLSVLGLERPDGVVRAALDRKQTIYLPNIHQKDPEFRFLDGDLSDEDSLVSKAVLLSQTRCTTDYLKPSGICAVSVSPIMDENENILGALVLASDTGDAFSEYDKQGYDPYSLALVLALLAQKIGAGIRAL